MTLSKIRATFDITTKAFVRSKGKVFSKFLVDSVFGIIGSSSLNLSHISRSLERDSKTTVKHIHKRLTRNLGQYDVTGVKESVQRKQARLIDDGTFIYFDPTDVVKPYGRRFEGLGLVPDGSQGHRLVKGYPIVSSIAIKNNEIIPLDLDIFSHQETPFDSKNQRHLYHIDGISEMSGGRGVFVLDREFDGFAYIRHLQLRSISFIIRMTEQRKYYPYEVPGRNSYHRCDVIDKYSKVRTTGYFDLKVKDKLEKRVFRIEATRVTLMSPIDSDRALYLIRAKSKGLTLYLLTNLVDISPESLLVIFQAYLDRWKIEEYIRFVKQKYGLEKFQVLSLTRIRNLIQLLFISTVILCRVSELGISLSKTRSVLINKAKRTYKLPQKLKFFLYMIADGMAYILRTVSKKIMNMIKSNSEKVPKKQLDLNFQS